MGDIFTNLKRTFNSGNILAKLIYINVGLFVIIRLASVILMLFNLGGFPFLQYLQVPSSPELLLYRPWTIITYMFTHFDFLHILFNMLWLYWFGGLFLTFFSERQLGGLYLLGGIAGAVLFLVAYNIFPYFRTVAAYSYLMGASASVMAIVFAVSFYRKDLEIGLFLIGRIKLIYLALFTFVIDLLAITSTNAGGHIAHIGGALFVAGMAVNLHSDHIIRHLRRPGDTRHYIPRGGMFRYVSSANYFGELLEWVGFAVASWSWAGTVFAWWTFANLAPRAASLRRRYEQEFGEEFSRLRRKRIIPFIY